MRLLEVSYIKASYVLVKPKLLASFMLRIQEDFLMLTHSFKVIKISDMEERKSHTRNKGGRPVKAVKRNKIIGVRCTMTERFIIEVKAKEAELTLSEFLRVTGLTGKIDIRKKVFPREVLEGIADLNHIAANLNQIAKNATVSMN